MSHSRRKHTATEKPRSGVGQQYRRWNVRHAEPDPYDDAEDERYAEQVHEPRETMGGADNERPK